MKIFVVTLKKETERQDVVRQRMAKLGLEFEFFYGVDGYSLSESELDRVDQEFCRVNFGHELSLGEIGCALSHIKLYEKIQKEDVERALILEDDAHLLSITPSILEALPNQEKHEIIYLYHGRAKKYPLKKSLPHEYRFVRYRYPSRDSRRFITGTVGYIVRRTAVEKLLQLAYPVRMPADYLTGFIQRNRLRAYGVEPCCVDTGHFDSTINDRNYGDHITIPKGNS